MSGLHTMVVGAAAVPVVAALLIAGAVFALAMTLLTMDGDRRSDLEKRLTGFAGDEAVGLQAVDHAGDRAGGEAGVLGELSRRERAVGLQQRHEL